MDVLAATDCFTTEVWTQGGLVTYTPLAQVKEDARLALGLNLKIVVLKCLLDQRLLVRHVKCGDVLYRVSKLRQLVSQVFDLLPELLRPAADDFGFLAKIGIHHYDRQPHTVDTVVHFFS